MIPLTMSRLKQVQVKGKLSVLTQPAPTAMHGSAVTLTGSPLPVCIPVSQPSAHVHGVHVTLTEPINQTP